MIMCILLMSRYKYHVTYGWKVHLKVNFGSSLTTSYTDLSQLMKTLELFESSNIDCWDTVII